jgi:hypothetical protein
VNPRAVAIINVFLLAVMAPAAAGEVGQHGDWQVNFGQGSSEYLTKGVPSGEFNITCEAYPTNDITSFLIFLPGLGDTVTNYSISIDDHAPIHLRLTDQGDVDPIDQVAVEAFVNLWHAMRAGRRMTVTASTGQAAVFSLRGSTAALDPDPCLPKSVYQAPKANHPPLSPDSHGPGGFKGEAELTAGSCRIEDWTYADKGSSIYLNGTATCSTGKLIYRLYDGETGEFIASDFTFIEGFAFQSYTDGRTPDKLRMKYVVEK